MSSSPAPVHSPATAAAPARARDYIVVLGSPVGVPQIIAGLLLAAFLAQCLWLAIHTPMRKMELAYIEQGQKLFEQHVAAAEARRSPVIPVLAATPLIGSGLKISAQADGFYPHPSTWRWRARLMFLAIGVLLGSSLWYVARRLYGNPAGYIALSLYAFSPPIILHAATIQPATVAAWGAFGALFTAIAVAHTLYAPREVVLWNWKRIGLLGLALTLAIGSEFALAAIAVFALLLMLYLVPERRGATLVIMAAACLVAFLLLFSSFGFDLHAMAAGLRTVRAADFVPQLLARRLTWSLLTIFFLRMPGVLVLLAAALLTYALWRRPRFFGVTAPLLGFVLLILLGITMPHLGGFNLFVASLPFAFVFIAGVFADLLETRYGGLVLGCVAGVILAQAIFSITGLMRLG